MEWLASVHFWHQISKNWQIVAPLFVSIVLAFITVLQWLVARKQWQAAEKQAQVAKTELRLTVFDRRIVIRDALLRMVLIATSTDDVTDEQRQACARGTKDAEFLFDKGIDDYCRLLLEKAVEFHRQKDLMRLNQDPESEKAKWRQKDHDERVQWWFEQEQEIPRRFYPFLKFEE